MSATRWHDATVALVALFQADPTLSTTLEVLVTDGLPISEDYRPDLLVIGGTPDEGDTVLGTVSQEWHDSGSGSSPRKDETVTIRAYVCSTTGDADLPATRARAFTVMAAVESVLRENRTIGLADVREVSLTDLTVTAAQYVDGTTVWLTFTIEVLSLI